LSFQIALLLANSWMSFVILFDFKWLCNSHCLPSKLDVGIKKKKTSVTWRIDPPCLLDLMQGNDNI
jgi:hypothetical protein